MLSPARRYYGQWYSRWKVNRCSIELTAGIEELLWQVEFGHGLELLMLVLETTMSSNPLRLMTETCFLWSDGF